MRENLFPVKIRSNLIYIDILEFDKYLFLVISVQRPSELGHNLDSRVKNWSLFLRKPYFLHTNQGHPNQRIIIMKIV